MKTHALIQGTPEWHAHRASHFNASDAPAMMGCSPHKSRTQLLHEMYTGLTPEIDAATQRRFDDGHRFEALARPLAEQIIGEDLYPVTGSAENLSASFDGLTIDEAIAFEHKTLNSKLRVAFEKIHDGIEMGLFVDAIDRTFCAGQLLPIEYRVQMEQQCMVSGARGVLFMASNWASDVVEEMHLWYTPDPALAAQITAGWQQFEFDLANYKPTVAAPTAVGHTPDQLPALHIQCTGQVTASNLAEFKVTALAAIANVNRTLTTDQDFADAEKSVKWCSDIEDRLAAAKQHPLSQIDSIDQLIRALDDIAAEYRRTRLDLEKLVKARKDSIKLEIVMEGQKALAEHVAALNLRLGKECMPAVPADFGGACKNKRTIESLKDAVATTLAKAKVDANAIADSLQATIAAEAAQQTQLRAFGGLAVTMAQFNATYAPKAAPGAVPDLKLGTIAERLGFGVTADFLAELGFVAKQDRSARLYQEADFAGICHAIAAHAVRVATQYTNKLAA